MLYEAAYFYRSRCRSNTRKYDEFTAENTDYYSEKVLKRPKRYPGSFRSGFYDRKTGVL